MMKRLLSSFFFACVLFILINYPGISYLNALELEEENNFVIGGALVNEPLRAEEAFKLGVVVEKTEQDRVFYALEFLIEGDYYLYRNKFEVSPEPVELTFSSNTEVLTDEFFGEQEVYRSYARAKLELPAVVSEFIISYQGCWDGGICYPLQRKKAEIKNAEVYLQDYVFEDATLQDGYAYYLGKLNESQWWLLILVFFIAGLGLTFTPCVLPMLPILTGIVTQRNSNSNISRRVALSLTYIGVMSITFSTLGFLSGFLGYGLREFMGSQPFLILMAAFVTALASSMLGLIRLRLPMVLTAPLNSYLSNERGAFYQAGLWGFLSPLIVGTCLSAPLAAAMIYLAEQGNPWLGALSLFALGLGIGLPIFLFAVGLGQVLPPSGVWLEKAQKILAFILLGLAVFILSPLLPSLIEFLAYILLLLACLFIGLAGLRLRKIALVGAAFVLVLAYIVYAPQYRSSPLDDMTEIDKHDDLRAFLLEAEREGKPSIIYYSADWCISCRELEWTVFVDKEVAERISRLNFAKIDITKSGKESRLLTKEFDVFGPPTLIFIGGDGRQIAQFTLIGYFTKESLLTRISSLSSL